MRASHDLHHAPNRRVLDEMGHELVRRASVANHDHVSTSKVERVVLVRAMEYPTPKILNVPDAFCAVWHIAEADGHDEKPRMPDVAAA